MIQNILYSFIYYYSCLEIWVKKYAKLPFLNVKKIKNSFPFFKQIQMDYPVIQSFRENNYKKVIYLEETVKSVPNPFLIMELTLTHLKKKMSKKFTIHLQTHDFNYLIAGNQLDKSFFLYYFYKHCIIDSFTYYFYLNLFSWFQFDKENIECCIHVLTTEMKEYTWVNPVLTIVSGGYKIK